MDLNFLAIIDKYNLNGYLAYFIKHNKGNMNPYHNLYHMQCVVENTYLLTQGSELTEKEIRILLIAAMFHDFNHTTNKDTESSNIADAIRGLHKCCVELGEYFDLKYVDLINNTSYPYTKSASELTFGEQVLRDADMLQCFDKNYIQQVVIGLSSEWKMDMVKSLDVQYNYVSSVEFSTTVAKIQAHKYRTDTLKMLSMLKTSLS
jgi:hypothetical protein